MDAWIHDVDARCTMEKMKKTDKQQAPTKNTFYVLKIRVRVKESCTST